MGVVLATLMVIAFAAHKPRPKVDQSSQARALASRIERAVNLSAWNDTRALRWTFAGQHHHLWDRDRGLVRVRWDDVSVLLRTGDISGKAYRGEVELRGDEARALIKKAHAYWINDSFWLNPIAKFHDPGVSLGTVRMDGQPGLLVSYASGGLTPGDAYLWFSEPDGTPRAWRMWVSIIPVGGVNVGWGGWKTLRTGARVSTVHRGPFGITLRLTSVQGARRLMDLVGRDDPFSAILSTAQVRRVSPDT